ncbi:MAG: fibrobacter succinogenes major paralogous domain-containing protein [Dysgonamonadaceae bacterium]|jgi:hypothetical protein|nr:fibrobacter succinogenes major paralogous domain-containing protein [Dysgonamonadaceae bacterium]
MKRKMILAVALFLATSVAGLFGQVRIGEDADPHEGAILDLSNPNGLGLKLPVVSLQNDEYLQVGDAVTAALDTDLDAAGMTVYNKNKFALDGAGIYVWDGSKWNGIYAQGKVDGSVIIPAPVCYEKIPSLKFTPYNLGANIAKLDSIAIADNISSTKAAIRCSYIDFGAVIGDLYQWGRVTDGHEKRNSAIIDISNLNTSDYNATGQVINETYKKDFITNTSSPFDWQTTPNDSLWGNGKAIGTSTDPVGVPYDGHYYQSTAWQMPSNNPCPAGFRVPTKDEWERIAAYDCEPDKEGGAKTMSTGTVSSYDMTETGLTWVRVKSGYASNESWSSDDKTGWAIYKTSDWNVAGANYKDGSEFLYVSGAPEPLLFLPAAGCRDYSSGSLYGVGDYGYYCSSSVDNSSGWRLHFYSNGVRSGINISRASGFSVRCAAEY